MDMHTDFPILQTGAIYLDSAASSLTPTVVVDSMTEYYTRYRSNVHRGLYASAEHATAAYEAARASVAQFVGAEKSEVVFTSGTTLSLNMAAHMTANSLGATWQAGDEILVTSLAHHSLYLPWQQIAAQRNLKIVMVQPNADGSLAAEDIISNITDRTKVVLLTHVSNVTGLILPVQEIAARCRERGIITIVDAAQSVAHLPVHFSELNVDFLAFSGHKLYGPTGIGALIIRKDLHDTLEPWIVGGGMVDTVGDTRSDWSAAPAKFEAGTPGIAEAIGLSRAIQWIDDNGGIHAFSKSEHMLYAALIAELQQIPDLQLIGYSENLQQHTGCVSFVMDGVHGHDIAAILAEKDIAARAGHHCCQPLMKHFGVSSTVRVSLAPYNTLDDIHQLAVTLKNIKTILGLS